MTEPNIEDLYTEEVLSPVQEGLYKHLVQMKHHDKKAFNRLRKPLDKRFGKTLMSKLK